MTRAEFNTGWNTLRGAGLQGALSADPDVYYSAMSDAEPRLWSSMVGRIVKTASNQWFPSVPQMFGYMATCAKTLQAVELDQKREQAGRLGRDPKTGDPFVDHHPALALQPGEVVSDYLARLAVKLGYMTEPRQLGRRMPSVEREIRLPYKEPADDEEAWEEATV